jgi:hypothetical protein
MKKRLAILVIALLALTAAVYGVTILSVAGSNGSQPEGGALTNGTLTNLYTDLASVGTVLGGATGAPSGTGAVCLTVGCAGDLTNFTGTPTGAGTTLSVTKALTLSQLQTLYSVGFQILPTPAATSMYVMGPCVLNLTHGSAAFTGGGAVSIGYGATFAATTPSPVTNGTIASTVFTTFTASHGVVVLPIAVAVTATTGLAGLPVFMSAATQDFASGAGGSGEISCQYSIATGVS